MGSYGDNGGCDDDGDGDDDYLGTLGSRRSGMMVASGGNCEGVAAVSMSAGGGTQGDLGRIKTSLLFKYALAGPLLLLP